MMVMAVFWNFGPWKFLQEWFETRNNIFKVKIMYEGQGNPNGMKTSWQHRFGMGKVCTTTFSYVYKICRRIEKWNNSVYLLAVAVWNGNLEDGEREWKKKNFFSKHTHMYIHTHTYINDFSFINILLIQKI